MFDKIVAKDQKQQEKEMKEKIERIEKLTLSVLALLAKEDVNLDDTNLVLKIATGKINEGAQKVKLSAIL